MIGETPVAGTFRLDGMIEGPLPGDRDTIEDINTWLAAAKADGLHFHFGMDGPNFSIVTYRSIRIRVQASQAGSGGTTRQHPQRPL